MTEQESWLEQFISSSALSLTLEGAMKSRQPRKIMQELLKPPIGEKNTHYNVNVKVARQIIALQELWLKEFLSSFSDSVTKLVENEGKVAKAKKIYRVSASNQEMEMGIASKAIVSLYLEARHHIHGDDISHHTMYELPPEGFKVDTSLFNLVLDAKRKIVKQLPDITKAFDNAKV